MIIVALGLDRFLQLSNGIRQDADDRDPAQAAQDDVAPLKGLLDPAQARRVLENPLERSTESSGLYRPPGSSQRNALQVLVVALACFTGSSS